MLHAKWEPLNLYPNVLWVVFSSETSVDRYTYTTLKAVQKAEFIHCVAYNDMLNLESHNIMVKMYSMRQCTGYFSSFNRYTYNR